jgi:hypothetical protein
MKSTGIEASATLTAVRTRRFDWTVGGSLYTNNSEVESLGGAADFSLGNFGWIMKGQAIPVIRTDFCVRNPDARGEAPDISSDPNECIFGPNLPTKTYGIHTGLQFANGINFVARGEWQGGHYIYDGAANAAVSRSVRWPGCYEFYRLQEAGNLNQAKPIDVARCTVSTTRSDYWIYPADFFKLREVSLSVPIPSRFAPGTTSANLTLAGHNIFKSVNDKFLTFDPETGNNGGFDSRVRSILEHVPPPASFTATLRVTF